MKKWLIILVVFGVFLADFKGALAAAGINRRINFQGKVVNKGVGVTDGTNVVDGNYDFKFALWDSLSAGTSLWTETWNSGTTQVAVSSGIFTVALGTQVTIPTTINFNSDSLYLSVQFNGDGDMTPRIRMTAVPYAFMAEKVNGLTVTATDGTLSVGNSKTVTFGDNFTTVAGVGITLDQSLSTGNTVAFAGLSIGGSVAFTNLPVGTGTSILYIGSGGTLLAGTLPPGGQAYTATNGLNLNGAVFGLGGTISTATNIDIPSYNLSFLGLGNTQSLFIGSTGFVGIGTTNPTHKLQVVGDVSFSSNLNVGGSLTFTGLTVGVGSSVLYIDAGGNILSGTLPAGSAANDKVIVLSPEYPGASLSADGSGTTSVAMTSDNTGSGSGWKNYYQLTSTEASLQDYSVIVRVTLPSDFDTWQTGTCPGTNCALEMAYQTGLAATTNNAISYIVSNDTDTPATAVCSIGSTASTSWGLSGCSSTVLNDNSAPEWDAAGETAVIRIKMAANSTSNSLVRAGDITLRYRSKF